MGRFFKVFFITFFISILIVMVGFYSYLKIFNPLDNLYDYSDNNGNEDDEDIEDDPNATPFENAKNKSKGIKINVLIVGLEHVRTDSIMVASFDRDTKEVNIYSVPRDTLYDRGFVNVSNNKINAIYQADGILGLKKAVEEILDIPINRWVTIDYDAVVKGVDALGGVEMDIPFHMKYTDPADNLYINIPAGSKRLLDGKNSLHFLRFRKGDPGYEGYVDGDIGRTKAQQAFVKAAIKKILSLKIANFINEVYPYVKTDFSITELIALATEAKGFTMDKLSTETLPGAEDQKIKRETGVSVYSLNREEIVRMMYKLYGIIDDTEESANE